MAQGQEVKVPERVEVWDGEAAEVEAEVLKPVREVIVFVPNAVKRRPINWVLRVMIKNALNAVPP
jgi:hypothetical protein